MPAAEIAGLAIGTIALATLFSTCVELFDLFEVGKNCVYDYDLACTKISLLRERLRAWGKMLRVMEPGAEDSALRDGWPTKREIVAASLIGLRRILCDSEALQQKYSMNIASIGFRRRTVWAIRDRSKFDRLIQDISFLIDGLEKITGCGSSESERCEQHDILYRRESLSDYWSSSSRRSTKLRETVVVRSSLTEHGSKEEVPNDSAESTQYAEQKQSRQYPQPSHWHEHVISGTQRNNQCSIGIQGLLGQTGDAFCITGVQINSENAIGIQGGASPESVAYLQQFAVSHSGFTRPNS